MAIRVDQLERPVSKHPGRGVNREAERNDAVRLVLVRRKPAAFVVKR